MSRCKTLEQKRNEQTIKRRLPLAVCNRSSSIARYLNFPNIIQASFILRRSKTFWFGHLFFTLRLVIRTVLLLCNAFLFLSWITCLFPCNVYGSLVSVNRNDPLRIDVSLLPNWDLNINNYIVNLYTLVYQHQVVSLTKLF